MAAASKRTPGDVVLAEGTVTTMAVHDHDIVVEECAAVSTIIGAVAAVVRAGVAAFIIVGTVASAEQQRHHGSSQQHKILFRFHKGVGWGQGLAMRNFASFSKATLRSGDKSEKSSRIV